MALKSLLTFNSHMGFVGEGAYSFGHEQEGGEKRFHGDSGVNRVTGLTPIFIASNRMAKIKLWKGKYEELRLLKDACMNQSTEIEEMQRKIDEYEVLTEEMTEDYDTPYRKGKSYEPHK